MEKSLPANSQKTAISREGPSSPCLWLYHNGLIKSPTLDWGCGKGADANFLNTQLYLTSKYDPHYHDRLPPLHSEFKTVLSIYVLNTIPDPHDRCQIVADMVPYVTKGGMLYVAIRADKAELKGWTKRGTWQGYVGDQLRVGGFDKIHRGGHFEVWGWMNG